MTVALGLACLAAPRAWAEESPRQELSASWMNFYYSSYLRNTPVFQAAEISYDRTIKVGEAGVPLSVGGGLRTGYAQEPFTGAFLPQVFPLEAFVRARLVARAGFWEASAGPELGLSGFVHLADPIPFPGRSELIPYAQEQAHSSPAYFTFGVEPLRLRFGRFSVSALELGFGSTFFPIGSTWRLQLGLLRLGVSL